MKNINLKYRKITLLIYSIVSFLIFFSSFSLWGIDYGIYYAVSEQMNEIKGLYNFYFTHKGPAYFIFIKFIGNVIGWGGIKIFIPYLMSIIFLLFSNLFLLKTLNLNPLQKFSLSLVFLGVFTFQNSNASIVYFQFGLILFALSFFNLFILKKNYLYLFFSMLFISIGILTRVDTTLILLAVFLILLLNKRLDLKALFLIIFVPSCTYMLFEKSLNFEFHDFFVHNISFNQEYLKHFEFNFLSMFHRVEHYKIIASSGILFLFLSLLFKFNIFFLKKNYKKKIKFKTLVNLSKNNNFFLILSACIFFSIWLYSKVETSHHVIPLFISLYFLSIFFIIKHKDIDYHLFMPTFLFVIIGLSHSYLHENINYFKNTKCLMEFKCLTLKNMTSTIKDLKNYNEIIILDPKGYEYSLSNKLSPITINNWPLIDNIDSSKYRSLASSKNYILKKKEITLWVRKTKLKNLSKTLETFDKKIKNITDQGYYLKVELINRK